MTILPYILLDVFTDKAFGGNPLAVFPQADGLSTEMMQRLANELNLSESSFIQKPQRETSDCTVRIFTPKAEMPMAGHPTLGTAHAILTHGLLSPRHGDHLVFDEGVGPVRVDFESMDGGPRNLWMHQGRPSFGAVVAAEVAAEVLSLQLSDIADDCPVQTVSCGVPFLIVPVVSLEVARRARVRMDRLESLACQEILLFTGETEDPQANVHCRMFAPGLGVMEDPATGGAHGPLGAYLVHHGRHQASETIVSEQGVELGRPSRLLVRVEMDEHKEVKQVLVGGCCVEMGKGELRLT